MRSPCGQTLHLQAIHVDRRLIAQLQRRAWVVTDMRQRVLLLILSCWRFAIRHSWAFTAMGGTLAAVGGIITNVTAAGTFKSSCGEGIFCAEGLKVFLFFTIEGLMICLGVIFTVIGSFATYQQQEAIESLQSDLCASRLAFDELGNVHQLVNAELTASTVDVFKVFSLILRHAALDLDFGNNERISLYRASDDKFFIIGRYSGNAKYNITRRKYHPRGSGVLEKAWSDGWAEFENRFSPNGNTTARKKYNDEHFNKCKVPVKVVSDINMKSRSYRALSIKGSDIGPPLAVVCLESLDWKRLDAIDRQSVQRRFDQLAILLEALEHHVASLDNAMSEGF